MFSHLEFVDLFSLIWSLTFSVLIVIWIVNGLTNKYFTKRTYVFIPILGIVVIWLLTNSVLCYQSQCML